MARPSTPTTPKPAASRPNSTMPSWLLRSERFWWLFMVTLHTVGALGMLSPLQTWFLLITPLQLLLVGGLVLAAHPGLWRRQRGPYLLWVGLAFCLGMGVEIVGVQTHWPFGAYSYTAVMGWGVAGVPFIIGLNWVMLTYVTGALAERLVASTVAQVLLGAFFLVALDGLLEPVAIQLKFWQWPAGAPGWENFAAWGVVGLMLHAGARGLGIRFQSRAAIPVLGCQAGFFFLLIIFG